MWNIFHKPARIVPQNLANKGHLANETLYIYDIFITAMAILFQTDIWYMGWFKKFSNAFHVKEKYLSNL